MTSLFAIPQPGALDTSRVKTTFPVEVVHNVLSLPVELVLIETGLQGEDDLVAVLERHELPRTLLALLCDLLKRAIGVELDVGIVSFSVELESEEPVVSHKHLARSLNHFGRHFVRRAILAVVPAR